MKIYFIRHGETDWNKLRRIQGHADIPLNSFGIHLAKETAKGLADVPFDVAFTSPLVRAAETAKLVLGDRNVPVIEDARIQEIGFGVYEGLCAHGEHANLPDKGFMKFFEDPVHYKAPEGGESLEEVTTRVTEFLNQLYQNPSYQNSNILIATHGAALCAIMRVIKGTSLEELWTNGVPKNCAVTIVEVTNQTPVVLQEGVVYYKDEVAPW